jgi:FtsP/CotA-like multicopper oxidase with cupredoxin domain
VELVNGVKIFHLIAEPLRHEIAPGLTVDAWGYNGRTPGPTIEAVEGDHIRIYVTNRLPEPTTVHWHGVLVPSGMDGVAGLSQRAIPPGETFKYEFTFRYPGTFMYHPHFDEMVQMALGMMGMIVVHPRAAEGPPPDRDYALMLSEWRVTPGTSRPNPNEMTDFNLFTFNSRAFPGTAPLVAQVGDRVRIRLGNLGAMSHHPIHLHGYSFRVVATDGGPIAPAGQWPETTVLVPVGTTRDIEFVANVPGDWAMHCHMTHHIMNQMGHEAPNVVGMRPGDLDEHVRPLLPGYMTMGQDGAGAMGEMQMPVPRNSIPMRGGPGPFGYIDMGGLFTIVKVRDHLAGSDDPGWYDNPPGSVAVAATREELRADGVATRGRSGPAPTS